MKRTLVFVVLLFCGCGPKVLVCPDGEPVTVLRSVEDAYPVFAKEYESKFTAAVKLINSVVSDVNASAETKSKVVKLRQDLDQERAALQERLKTVVVSLQTTPCDKDVRKRAWELQQDFGNRANQIPERVKAVAPALDVKGEHRFSSSRLARAQVIVYKDDSLHGYIELENDAVFVGFSASVTVVLRDANAAVLTRVDLPECDIPGKPPGKAIRRICKLDGHVEPASVVEQASALDLEFQGGT